MKKLASFFIILLSFSFQLAAQSSLNTTSVGHWGYGTCNAVADSGNYVFISKGYMFLVIDKTDLTNPEKVGELSLPEAILEIQIQGNYAYIADGAAGLRVIDISNHSAPHEAGFFDDTRIGTARAVAVNGNYAYLADNNAGLRIIDISNPANPQQVGIYDTPGYAYDVAVSGNFAYVADHNGGMRIIDISNPASPVETGSAGYPYFERIAINGDYAYVGCDFGVNIIDISDVNNPIIVSLYLVFGDEGREPEDCSGLSVSGKFLYVTSSTQKNLIKINISNPSNPVGAGSSYCGPSSHGITVSGNYAYVASKQEATVPYMKYDLRIFDISNSGNPQAYSSYFIQNTNISGIAVNADFAYIADGLAGLRIINISNPANPQVAGSFNTPGIAYRIVVKGNLAYVADGDSGLRIIDISNHGNPIELGYIDTPGTAFSLTIEGNFAYVSDGTKGLRIIDISNPASPHEIGFYDTQATAYGAAIVGNYAYVADDTDGLRIIDISNPANPVKAGFYDTPGESFGIAVKDNYAYIADGVSQLCIIDISNPLSPQEAGLYYLWDSFTGVTISGSYAYISTMNNGLRILDISDPLNFKVSGFYDPPPVSYNNAGGIAVSGNLIYLANNLSGFGTDYRTFSDFSIIKNDLILGVDDQVPDIETGFIKIYPNPTSDFIQLSGYSGSSAYISVFDMTGRNVFSQKVEPGRNINVSELDNGIYTASIIYDKSIKTVKLVINR